jgi:hypothetical protein
MERIQQIMFGERADRIAVGLFGIWIGIMGAMCLMLLVRAVIYSVIN